MNKHPSSNKLHFRVINYDITDIKAEAVVTGEGQWMNRDSAVTKSLEAVIPKLKVVRSQLKDQHHRLNLWTAHVSSLGSDSRFQYVIHAVLDKGNNDKWLRFMKTLYKNIFKEADKHNIMTIALPVLGSGTSDSDRALSVDALVTSLLAYSPSYDLTLVKVVTYDQDLCELVKEQIKCKESSDYESKTGFISKVLTGIKDFASPFSYYDARKALIESKRDAHLKKQEEEHLQKALQLSKQQKKEKEENKSQVTLVQYTVNAAVTKGVQDENVSTGTLQPFEGQTTAEDTRQQVHLQDVKTMETEDSKTDSIRTCPICLSAITKPKKLEKCGHVFCQDCIDQSFRDYKPVCPSCNMVYGVITGNQPEGNMDVGFSSQSLPSYEHHGTITITYSFPSGIQKAGHPKPGKPYKGTTRRAYLPDCREGREILNLLRTAFDRKLTFTVGRSTTTGQDNVITWNDIHHKTNMDGGPTRFGYPDPTYLTRVRDELESKGVTKTPPNF